MFLFSILLVMVDICGYCGFFNDTVNYDVHEVIYISSCLFWKFSGSWCYRVVVNNDVGDMSYR